MDCSPPGSSVQRGSLGKNIGVGEVKWALGSTTTNKASGGDGIPVELFQILKDDAVKVLHSICQQIWNPVGEGTTRRGTATPVHRPQRPAGSTHTARRGA